MNADDLPTLREELEAHDLWANKGLGQHFLLDTGTLDVLDYYRDTPAIKIWNAPLVEAFRMAEEMQGNGR